MRITKKFLVLLLEIQKIKKNAQNNSGIVVSWSLMFSWGDNMRQGDTNTSQGVSWSLGGRTPVSWTPGDPSLTTKRHHEIFWCLLVSFCHQETMRHLDGDRDHETTFLFSHFLDFCISKSKTRNFFVILMKFSCV